MVDSKSVSTRTVHVLLWVTPNKAYHYERAGNDIMAQMCNLEKSSK